MSFYAVVLVPTKIMIHTETRAIASEEAREWARQQEPVGEYIAKVLIVQPVPGEPLPPRAA